MTTLIELATIIRSKNAGPTMLTIDIFLRDAAAFERAIAAPGLARAAIAHEYGCTEQAVERFELPELNVIKISFPRRVIAGTPGDGDVYGAQQHAPLLAIEL